MDLREKILRIVCSYYKIDYKDYASSIFCFYNEETMSNPPMVKEQMGNYDLYNISKNFLLFFVDYSRTYTTNLMLDSSNRGIFRDITDSHHLSRLHRHHYFELVYVIDGQLDLIIEKKHHRFSAGDACIINSNVRHVEEYTSDFSAIYLSMKSEFLDTIPISQKTGNAPTELLNFLNRNRLTTEDIDYLNFTAVFQSDDHVLCRINKTILLLIEEMLYQEDGFMTITRQYIHRLFLYFQDPALYLRSNIRLHQTEGQGIFEQILNYIYTHKHKITREELGDALGYNGNYLSQIFKKHTRQTLAEYTRNVCLAEAANLLLNTQMNISDIIQALGFENKTAFYSQFKRKYHMTPNEYRHSR